MAEDRTHATFVTLGATNHGKFDRELDDYYATDPRALEMLLESESFSKRVWEPACGAGHLSKVLVTHGHDVTSTDLVDRGYGTPGVDFLATFDPVDSDIVTNPPYKYALEFVQHAIDVVTDGHKIAMLLRLNFLEGKKRRELFDTAPPQGYMLPLVASTVARTATSVKRSVTTTAHRHTHGSFGRRVTKATPL